MQSASDEQPTISDNSHQALLRAVASELKTPLMYIARQAELSSSSETISHASLHNMQTNADTAIRLVDSYILGLDLAQQELVLEQEPVALSSLLYDVAHDLEPLAKQRGVDIELVLAGKYGQVMTHRQGLVAALFSLGAVLSAAATEHTGRTSLKLAAHKSPHGIITGLYLGEGDTFKTSLYAATQLLQGKSEQPFAGVTAQSGAGVFVADHILRAMQAKLRSSHFRGSHGLAVTLQQSQQLRLV